MADDAVGVGEALYQPAGQIGRDRQRRRRVPGQSRRVAAVVDAKANRCARLLDVAGELADGLRQARAKELQFAE